MTFLMPVWGSLVQIIGSSITIVIKRCKKESKFSDTPLNKQQSENHFYHHSCRYCNRCDSEFHFDFLHKDYSGQCGQVDNKSKKVRNTCQSDCNGDISGDWR